MLTTRHLEIIKEKMLDDEPTNEYDKIIHTVMRNTFDKLIEFSKRMDDQWGVVNYEPGQSDSAQERK